MNSLIKRYKQQVLGQTVSSDKEKGGNKSEPETPVIMAVYQKEGGNPETSLIIKKGKTTVIEGTGLTNQSGDAAGDLILASTWSEEPLDDKVPAANITLNTDTRIEFTMTEYLTEGKYSLRIETYYNGEGNPPRLEPVVIKFPEEITF